MIASDGSKTIALEDVAPIECPSSIIYRFPQMDSLAQQVSEALGVKELTGAFPFGSSDSMKWPAKWFDVVQIAQTEEARLNRAVDQRRSHQRG